MGEINYWICDCCGREDHWPRMPDGTPVEKGIGVCLTAQWVGKFVSDPSNPDGHLTRWLIKLLHVGSRGDERGRRHSSESIWLCKDCRDAAETAAGEAALEVLQQRGLPSHEEMMKTRVHDYRSIQNSDMKAVLAAIVERGFASLRGLTEHNPPAGLNSRAIKEAVRGLLDRYKIRKVEVYTIRKDGE